LNGCRDNSESGSLPLHPEKAMGKLCGKVAVVTGAARGIGASIAEHLAAEGASVVVNYATSKSAAEDVVGRITDRGGKAVAVQCSVVVRKDLERLFAATKGQYGKLDILVNNAGFYEFAPLEAITPEHIQKHWEINVVGLIFAIQEAVKLMGPEGGSIVNIGSIVGSMPAPQAAVLSATKAAADAITVSLSQELGPRKIRVNSLSPGMVETEGLRASGLDTGAFRDQQERETPLGRIARPDDIASAVAFLAGDDARWITGQVIIAAGGRRM
jgi:3-oxoacyl-[acyl-carrier protein] reductase